MKEEKPYGSLVTNGEAGDSDGEQERRASAFHSCEVIVPLDSELQMLPVSIRIEREGTITIRLRNAETASEMEDEVILDVDHAGHWIRGIEILGSVGFDLARAVRPFNPKRPQEAGRIGVTYDEEANAAFFYMKMKTSPLDTAARYSHSIHHLRASAWINKADCYG